MYSVYEKNEQINKVCNTKQDLLSRSPHKHMYGKFAYLTYSSYRPILITFLLLIVPVFLIIPLALSLCPLTFPSQISHSAHPLRPLTIQRQ